MNSAVVGVVAVLAAVGLVMGGLNYYYYTGLNTQLQQDKATIAGLQSSAAAMQTTLGSLQSQLGQAQQTLSTQGGQIATLQTGLQNVGSQLSGVIQELNTASANDLAFQTHVSAELQSINASLTSLTDKVNSLTPQIPLSTLVVIASSYDTAKYTFTFTVQNTQNVTIHAQLSATFWGTQCTYYNSQGNYLSQIITFRPLSNTSTVLNMALGSYQSNGLCGHSQIVYLTMSYVAAPSTSVSPTYTFNVVPYYTWP